MELMCLEDMSDIFVAASPNEVPSKQSPFLTFVFSICPPARGNQVTVTDAMISW